MVTVQGARRSLEQYFVEHPPAISGQLHIGSEWWEDAEDYLPTWGAREYLVDGRVQFNRNDNLAIFIAKRTGVVRREAYILNLDKIDAMTPVEMPDIEALAADPRMLAALSAANAARFDWHDALLAVGDMEVLHLIRAVDGRYVLNRTSRGSAEREVARADELELVVDYLRFELRPTVGRGDIVPPGFRIDAGDRELTLIHDDGDWSISVPDGIGARRGLIAFAVEGRDR